MKKLVVRHNASNAVVATIEPLGNKGEVMLVSVVQHNGALPETGHLQGQLFPSLEAVRLALVAAMKGNVGDTLDNALLSAAVYTKWQEIAVSAARKAIAFGVSIDEIPDEMAKCQPNGDLLIWVDLPKVGRVEYVVPKQQWEWRHRPS